jgi:hypothetical protein
MRHVCARRRIFAATVVLSVILIMQPARGWADESWHQFSVWEGMAGFATLPKGALQEARADETEGKKDEHETELSNLGLLNFFSEGWGQPWAHRHRRTPDMALLRVCTNFLERELRLDYAYTDVRNNPALKDTHFLNSLIAYGVNRRLMFEVIANYQWNLGGPTGAPVDGAGAAGLLRFQLVDTPDKSYSAQVRVSAPNKGIGQTQTSFQYTLAGWQDMQALIPFLDRVGLYYSFQYENLQGSHKAGGRSNDISYDLSVAKTWTNPTTPVVGNFTTFLEAYATADLDGDNKGVYVVTLTPGIRFWFLPKNSFTMGVDFPVTDNPPFREVYRFTYILNF